MAKITQQATILVAKDYAAAVAYWRDKLGFSVASQYGEPLQFAILKRDQAFVMIGAAKPDAVITPYWKQRDGLWNAYFWVDDARAMYDEMKSRGAIIDYHLEDKPYGVREFGVRDGDDHDIGFGQVLEN
ncbi:MAG: VOC family protein [Beijerinckiaceae bacterium]